MAAIVASRGRRGRGRAKGWGRGGLIEKGEARLDARDRSLSGMSDDEDVGEQAHESESESTKVTSTKKKERNSSDAMDSSRAKRKKSESSKSSASDYVQEGEYD